MPIHKRNSRKSIWRSLKKKRFLFENGKQRIHQHTCTYFLIFVRELTSDQLPKEYLMVDQKIMQR